MHTTRASWSKSRDCWVATRDDMPNVVATGYTLVGALEELDREKEEENDRH